MFNLYRKMRTAVGVVLCLLSVVYAYSDGNGTPAEPYQIASASDWNDLMKTASDWNKYFIMTADVNLQGLALTPVGNSTTNFTGAFDGNGYVIYNADMSRPTTDIVGLFGRVGAAGRISNLGIEDVNMTGRSNVGGLAGQNYGTITDCDVAGRATGNSNYAGGLAGRNLGTITGCCGQVAVTATGSSIYVGGLAGNNTSIIKNSCALGTVSGNGEVGGLTGRSSGTIASCYAAGAVNANSSVGGLVGYISGGSVNTCYSAGPVDGNSNVGGLIGYKSSGSVDDSNTFWDVNTSDCNSSAGGTGKTTAEMKTLSTFTSTGWDFLGETVNGTEDSWRMCVDGLEYPKFSWQFPLDDFACPDGVDFLDFAYFAPWWLQTNCSLNNDCGGTDIYKDGTVDFLDLAVFVEDWLEGT